MNNNENNENNENVQKKKNVRLNKYDKKVIKRILCKHTSSAYSKKYARLQVPINSIRVLASKELGKEISSFSVSLCMKKNHIKKATAKEKQDYQRRMLEKATAAIEKKEENATPQVSASNNGNNPPATSAYALFAENLKLTKEMLSIVTEIRDAMKDMSTGTKRKIVKHVNRVLSRI